MTVTYIYKGYGITDENGKAHLEYDSSGNPLTHSYTGTGAGEIDIVASLDDTITESSIISNTYKLIDAKILDPCTTETTGRWYNYQNILSLTYNDSGLTITKEESNNTQRYLYWNDTAISTTKVGGYNSITTPMQIEFDATAMTGSIQLVFVDNASPSNQRFIEITSTGHYQIVLDGETVTVYCDNTQIGNSLALTGTNTQFRLGFNAANESITLKDLLIYPI